MNDRFRLKLWDKINGNWVKEFRINQDGLVLGLYNAEQAMKRRFVLVQCTGLKDKNGKLIYEGDIVKGYKNIDNSPHSSKMVEKIGVIEIPDSMFIATCQDKENNCTLFCQIDWCKTEIIGNIYENKELLNEN